VRKELRFRLAVVTAGIAACNGRRKNTLNVTSFKRNRRGSLRTRFNRVNTGRRARVGQRRSVRTQVSTRASVRSKHVIERALPTFVNISTPHASINLAVSSQLFTGNLQQLKSRVNDAQLRNLDVRSLNVDSERTGSLERGIPATRINIRRIYSIAGDNRIDRRSTTNKAIL